MKRVAIILLVFTSIVFPQKLTQIQSSQSPIKIHPFFQEEINNVKNGIVSTSIGIKSVANNEQGEKIYRAMIRISDEVKILNSGVNINSVIPGFATARITLDEMERLAREDYVSFIYPGETLYPTNDIGGTLIGADLVKNGFINSTTYDGTDVIVLIVDTGIDWSHADFQNSGSPNTSRILYVWDQTLTAGAGEGTPEDRDGTNFSGLNYGVEYTQSHINDEIDGSPTGFVREEDTNGHGTHVAGSAAGNASSLSTNKYEGIAYKADIVFVKAGNGSFPTTNTVDALEYAQKISDTEGKPVVVNMSLGGHANAHDGTSELDVAVDNFTSSRSGRVAVISAGNEGNSAIHITGTTASSASSNITISVPSYTANAGTGDDYLYLDLWWNNADNVTASVTSPNSHSHSQISNSHGIGITADGYIYISNYVDASHTNGDRRNYFKIYDGISSNPPAQGNWIFTVTNNSASTMTYHAWLFSSSMGASLTGGDTDYLVGSPGVASSALTVGSYVSRWMWSNNSGSGYLYGSPDRTDNISDFSSIGPRRDGIQKPDITAPGQGIFSSTSIDYTPTATRIAPGSKHHMTQGTSMSSPICAGAVALMLDYSSSLTAAQIKAYITGNADTDSFTGTVPN
ncbi:MAG: S8 family serine peptidase [Melioribacteraceae bacterium]|nr:S8 family serine peptidase [Melioribacteraceae bacterium]